MADEGLPALPIPPALQAPPVPQASQPPPDQPVPTQLMQHMPQLNWSHFNPEFPGKPEDAEAH